MPSEDSHQLIRRAESYATRDDLRASSRFLFFWGPTLTSWVSGPSEVDDCIISKSTSAYLITDSSYWLQAQGLSSSSRTSEDFISTTRACNDLCEYCHPPWPPLRSLSPYLRRTMIIGLGVLTTWLRTSPTYGNQNISLGLAIRKIRTDSYYIASSLSHLKPRRYIPFHIQLFPYHD